MIDRGRETDGNNEFWLGVGLALCIIKAVRLVCIERCSGTVVTHSLVPSLLWKKIKDRKIAEFTQNVTIAKPKGVAMVQNRQKCRRRCPVRMAERSKAPDSRFNSFCRFLQTESVLVHVCGRGFESHFWHTFCRPSRSSPTEIWL